VANLYPGGSYGGPVLPDFLGVLLVPLSSTAKASVLARESFSSPRLHDVRPS
jgi:hypothetical protein